MITIKYEKNKFLREKCEIAIEDTKNVFLKGRNPFDNLPTYFGVWVNDGGLSIVTIISYRTIKYRHYLNTKLYTESDIEEYLRNNDNVEVISKDEFEKQINHIQSIFKM